MRLRLEDYDAIELFLRQGFGEPKFGPNETSGGGRIGGYRLGPGGAIQFSRDKEGTQVIVLCIRGTPTADLG